MLYRLQANSKNWQFFFGCPNDNHRFKLLFRITNSWLGTMSRCGLVFLSLLNISLIVMLKGRISRFSKLDLLYSASDINQVRVLFAVKSLKINIYFKYLSLG